MLGKKKNMKDLNNALKKAEILNYIERLDKKGDHELSKQFKHGTKLSTGQLQKVALARMFYRDAPILILDEPTASIDAVSEYRIFNRIYNFTKNKSVIIVSHRFSTVRSAQKIYVFKNGKVVEEGSHEKLVKINGEYAKAFKLQAKGYSN
jgi:ABC-type multidrug transport system fused ATPase/permease subunit